MSKYTTKILYQAGNACGNQYAPGNCQPYGTKWRARIKIDNYGYKKIVGTPVCIDDNWDIDENKVESTNRYFE